MDYHYIVVGGGAAGCMAAYRLSKKYPNKRIVILEINSNTLDDYKKTYSKSADWIDAMYSGYSKSFQSVDGKTVWVGKGLGGGTLHFGLQYIDQEKIIDPHYTFMKDIFTKISDELEPYKYDYSTNTNITDTVKNLKTAIENEDNVDFYNNKVYAQKGNPEIGYY